MTWGNGDGADMNVYDTAAGMVGALVCFEHANPLFRYSLIIASMLDNPGVRSM